MRALGPKNSAEFSGMECSLYRCPLYASLAFIAFYLAASTERYLKYNSFTAFLPPHGFALFAFSWWSEFFKCGVKGCNISDSNLFPTGGWFLYHASDMFLYRDIGNNPGFSGHRLEGWPVGASFFGWLYEIMSRAKNSIYLSKYMKGCSKWRDLWKRCDKINAILE
jgi:hypothetical protein